MAFFSHALSPSELIRNSAPRRGLLSRFYAAMLESRQRMADREIARYLHLSGGLTDTTEREIERRFLSGGFK
jgi:hypothetical protein